MRKLAFLLAALMFGVAVTLLATVAPRPGAAADHLDAPDLSPPNGNLMADIADLFIFPPEGMPGRVVIAATYNPASGVFGPAGFDPSVTYELNVTNDGDAGTDIRYTVEFGPMKNNGRQDFSLARDGKVLADGTTGRNTRFADGTGRVIADVFDDPFFFDLDAFLGSDGRGFCDGDETDFFAGLNVNAIVVDIPVDEVGGGPFGVWAATRALDGQQIDRVGFPAINTVFIPTNRKNRFNSGAPGDDEDDFFRFLRRGFKGGGNTTPTAKALADALLPDILPYDPAAPSGFLNGRRLDDDVIDAELGLLTAGTLAGDCVDANDVPFRDGFPYLAPAH